MVRIWTCWIALFYAASILIGCTEVAPVRSKDPIWRGVNLSGQRYTRGNEMPVSAAIDYFVREKKMDLIRLNLDWDRLQPEINGPLDQHQIEGINDQIEEINRLGAKAQIEVHSYGRRTINGAEYIVGETGLLTSEHFSDLWAKLAFRWKDNPNVIFELANEPHDQDTTTLMRVQNGAISAIRRTGANNLVVLSGNQWSQADWFLKPENRLAMLELKDPLNRTAIAIHRYFDRYRPGKDCSVYSDSINDLAEFTKWARSNNLKALVGEFGACATTQGKRAVTVFLNHIEANTDVYLGWTWWAGGGWWQDDYIFLLDPYGSQWDKNNPHRNVSLGGTGRATTWAEPRPDRPQMDFLKPYIHSDF